MTSAAVHHTAVRGADIAWTETGTGPTTFWAHGLSSSRDAQEQLGMFDWSPVSRAGRRLIRYDARGHGQSTSADVYALFEWCSLGKDFLGLADTLAPGERVSGIGTSMGTATLLWAAVDDPTRFDRLVLTAAPTARETRASMAAAYEAGAAMVERDGIAGFAAMSASLPVPAPFSQLPNYPPPLDVDPALLPSVLRGAARSDLPPLDLLRRIDLPVLLLSWTGDPGHPVSSGDMLADAIPGARLEVSSSADEILNWGHTATDFLETKAG
jgi:3-oxoadipate enol-lactonase